MVKTSASRLMTTPLNFIFEPLGTERAVMLWFCVACVLVVVTWPNTAGAMVINAASAKPTVNGCNLLRLIVFAPSIIQFRNAQWRASGASSFVGAVFRVGV